MDRSILMIDFIETFVMAGKTPERISLVPASLILK